MKVAPLVESNHSVPAVGDDGAESEMETVEPPPPPTSTHYES